MARFLWSRATGLVACCMAAAASLCDAAGSYQVVRAGDRLCYYLSPADGTLQPYHVYVPVSYRPSQPTPVVFSLHGFGGRTAPAGPGLRGRWAEVNTWLLVRPDGRGSQNWDGLGEDDVFLVLADLQRDTPDHPALNIDAQRLYVEGASMGGHGAYRLATRYAGVFAAVAPVAGWTTYREFYAHWYDAYDAPHMPAYVDPARLPVLETASSLFQAENALWTWLYATYDVHDRVNPPWNARRMLRRLRGAGSVRAASRAGGGGHGASYDVARNFDFFRGKSLKLWPATVRLRTNTLRYNRAHWLTVERLRVLNRWADVEARVSGQSIHVETENVLQFGMDLSEALLDLQRPVNLTVNGQPPFSARPEPHLSVAARLDGHGRVRAWSVAAHAYPPPGRQAVRKTPALCGPIGDAFRSRFTVIYGAQAGSPRGAAGRDREDALRFAADWNAWMTLHWGNERPPPERSRPWWQPPYPFRPGRHVHPQTPVLTPRPDTDFTLHSLPLDRNLVLFGDPASNWIVAQIADKLPLPLSLQNGGGVRVQCGARRYGGDYVNYLFIAPNPLAPDHYVVLARGYLSSRIDPKRYGARKAGKDLEALPFYWPDYVIWDARRQAGPTVQRPFRYLPDTFLEAGYFAVDWQPVHRVYRPRLRVQGGMFEDGVYTGPLQVVAETWAAPGGFGVSAVEYRLNDGPWQTYRDPVRLQGRGPVTVSARAVGNSGQTVYVAQGNGYRGVPASGIVSKKSSMLLHMREESIARRLWRRWFQK